MKYHFFALFLILALTVCAFAQESAPASQVPPGVAANAQTPDQAAINATLKAYVDAYGTRNIDNLVAIWPDLPNQKKDYKKIKEHFTDSKISHDKVSLNGCETQAMKSDVVVKCERIEEYIKTEEETSYFGDAMMASPAQRPPPNPRQEKHTEKKHGNVWVKLHKDGDSWKIVSVSEKPLSL